MSLATELAAGNVGIEDACLAARECTGGSMRKVGGIRQRVLSGGSQGQLEGLNAFIGPLSPSDLRKWAGVLLLTHAFLGAGDAAGNSPAADTMAFDGASSFVVQIIDRSGGKCPRQAVTLAVAMVDAVLRHPLCESDTDLQIKLMRVRALYESRAQPVENSDLDKAFDAVLACFDSEGWEYDRQPGHRSVMVQFSCPIGQTRLGCSISSDREFLVAALDVIKVDETNLSAVEACIQQRCRGVSMHHSPERHTVVLEGSCAFVGTLARDEIMKTIIRVNGAAEALLLLNLRG